MKVRKVLQKRWFRLSALCVFLFLAAFALFHAADPETLELNDETRKKLGGDYISLGVGTVHYEQYEHVAGDRSLPPVVFVHGSTVSIWDFDLQAIALRDAGVDYLRFDALGRGLSDRPSVEYNRDLYKRQLNQLLDKFYPDRPVILVGHSLGGATAVNFAAGNPSRVAGLLLVSPVINSVASIPPFVICRLPVVGPLIHRLALSGVLAKRARGQWLEADVDVASYERLFAQQQSIEGFEYAICSMFRSDLVGDYRPAYDEVSASGVGLTLVYGSNDSVIGLDYVDELRREHPAFEIVEYNGAGHSAHVSDVDRFNTLLLDFVQKVHESQAE